MKYYLKLGFVLLLITAAASGILAYINSFTNPVITENKRKAKAEARQEVLPEAISFDSLAFFNGDNIFRGINESGETAGYTFLAELSGYSDKVKTMVGVNPDLTINRIKVIEQKETPGLGANCEKPEFMDQFNEKNQAQLKVDKDGGEIVSLTGATITTRAIANSIRDGLKELEEILKTESSEEVAE